MLDGLIVGIDTFVGPRPVIRMTFATLGQIVLVPLNGDRYQPKMAVRALL
jgi:hypothetical protein